MVRGGMVESNKTVWERQHTAGKHVMSYPVGDIPSHIFRRYGKNTDKSKIRVLEIGSGTGNNLWFFARERFKTYGIEISEVAVRISKEFLETEGLKADIRAGSFTDLSDFQDEFFDLVLDRHSLCCVEKPEFYQALSEILRVLKKGGSFFSFTYSDQSKCLQYGEKISENTYTNFTKGPFVGIGIASFVNKNELLWKVYKGYKVEYIKRSRADLVYPIEENELEVFIAMGKKV